MHAGGRIAAVVTLLLGSEACRAADPSPNSKRLTIRHPDEIEFTATVNAKAFDRGWMMPGYHAVVWKKGRMAQAALLQAHVTDVEILDALESLGAKAGGDLPMDAWEARRDPRNSAPDSRSPGTRSRSSCGFPAARRSCRSPPRSMRLVRPAPEPRSR